MKQEEPAPIVTIQEILKEEHENKQISLQSTEILLEDHTKLQHAEQVIDNTSHKIKQGKWLANGFTFFGAIKNLFVKPPKNKQIPKQTQLITPPLGYTASKPAIIKPKDDYDLLLDEVLSITSSMKISKYKKITESS
jgi:hypothetical protein